MSVKIGEIDGNHIVIFGIEQYKVDHLYLLLMNENFIDIFNSLAIALNSLNAYILNMNTKRLLVGTGFGMLLGIFCILGVSQRIPTYVFNDVSYLAAAWYNRVIMGIIIGLAGELELIKNSKTTNSILRGAIIGAIVSVEFGIFGQTLEIMFFFAGIMFGVINDFLTTKIAG